MNDYLDRLESQLARLTKEGAHLEPSVIATRRRALLGTVLTAVAVAAAVVVAVVVLVSVRSHPHAPVGLPSVRHAVPGPGGGSLAPGEVPTLQQLLQNFAILRRPQTAADRSWQPKCGCGGSARQLTGLTRLARTLPGGYRIFLDVEQFTVGGQLSFAAGSYVLNVDLVDPDGNASTEAFGPNTQYSVYPLTSGGPPARRGSSRGEVWASVIPDGVAEVAWTVGCSTRTVGCSSAGAQTITLPVIDNVAARAITLPRHCDPGCSARPSISWRTNDGRVFTFSGAGNLVAPPFVKGWRGNPVREVLLPSALGGARLGQPMPFAVAAIEHLLGPASDTNLAVNACGIDHATVWTSPEAAEPLTIFAREGRFVGYRYGAPASEIGLAREPGAVLATARGLTLADTVGTARRLYGTGLHTSATHGGTWRALGDRGTLTGAVLPISYPLRSVNDKNPIATIEAGNTGCAPNSTP